MDFRGKGAESGLVGHDFGRQGHGEQGAAVKSQIKGNHPGTTGGMTRDLYGVFHGLGPAVEKRCPFFKGARRDLDKFFGQGHVRFVHAYMKTGVNVFAALRFNGLDHPGVAMAHVHHADAPGEIDEFPPLHIGDHGSLGLFHKMTGDVEHPPGNRPGSSFKQCFGLVHAFSS